MRIQKSLFLVTFFCISQLNGSTNVFSPVAFFKKNSTAICSAVAAGTVIETGIGFLCGGPGAAIGCILGIVNSVGALLFFENAPNGALGKASALVFLPCVEAYESGEPPGIKGIIISAGLLASIAAVGTFLVLKK